MESGRITSGRFAAQLHLDVTEYDRIFLPVQDRFLIHAYSDSAQCNAKIRCHNLEELLAGEA